MFRFLKDQNNLSLESERCSSALKSFVGISILFQIFAPFNETAFRWQERARSSINTAGQGYSRQYIYTPPLFYRALSLTWSASMQIYWNKRKRLHEKRVQLPQDLFGTPTWPPFQTVSLFWDTNMAAVT